MPAIKILNLTLTNDKIKAKLRNSKLNKMPHKLKKLWRKVLPKIYRLLHALKMHFYALIS